MLNVKQESCKYQLFKFFGLSRSGIGNQTHVYRMQSGRSKLGHVPVKVALLFVADKLAQY